MNKLGLYLINYQYPDAISFDIKITYAGYIDKKNYNKMPFEFKIGLLKFICDLHEVKFTEVLESVGSHYSKLSYIGIIFDICGESFIESILN